MARDPRPGRRTEIGPHVQPVGRVGTLTARTGCVTPTQMAAASSSVSPSSSPTWRVGMIMRWPLVTDRR